MDFLDHGPHRLAQGSGGLFYLNPTGENLPFGVEKEVTFVEADPNLNNQIDDAYRTKYRRYAANIVGSIVSPKARSATIKLVPRATSF